MIDKNYKYFFTISLFTTFVILVYGVYLDPVFEQREGLRPREGISLGYSDQIQMDDISLYIINTRETDSIELRYNARYLDPSIPGKIGVYFPYSLKMITNTTDWEAIELDSGTAFMKKYSCDENSYCKTNFNEQPIFELIPEFSKFDTKNRHNHGIKVGFDSAEPPESDEFFRDFNMRNDPLNFWYDDSTNRQLSIIIPRTSDNIHPIPGGEPGIFHNRGIDYSNNRITWKLSENDHAFFLDYEMPKERENFETSKLLITMSGIVIGMLIGAIGIAMTFFQKKKTLT